MIWILLAEIGDDDLGNDGVVLLPGLAVWVVALEVLLELHALHRGAVEEDVAHLVGVRAVHSDQAVEEGNIAAAGGSNNHDT